MKSAKGLVDYAKAQLGRPYWYGTFGQIATAQLYEYNKGRLPSYYTAADFPRQFGKRVHDCAGLIKGYLWSETPESVPQYGKDYPDINADQMRQSCTETGDISTLPETPGVLLFYSGHVGVYIGNGQAIEARGHAYGVVQTSVKSRSWRWWGKLKYLDYGENEMEYISDGTMKNPFPEPTANVKNGTRGASASWVQWMLNQHGYSLDVDGIIGVKSVAAIRDFQKSHGLTVDGICGVMTRAVLKEAAK